MRSIRIWLVMGLAVSPIAGAARAQESPSAPESPTLETARTPETKGNMPMGMGGPGGGMGGPGGGMGGAPGYEATWYPTRSLRDSMTDFGLVRQSLNIGAPVYRDGGDMVMASLRVTHSLFSTDAVLPDTGRRFPGELWNVNLGLTFLHKFENGWTGGLMTGFGSASEQPFHSLREMNVNLGAFLTVPARNERDSWMFAVIYSPAGNLNFPIPGVAYVWNPSERLRVNIGLPFSVLWKPTEDLTVNISYVPLTNVNARATYKLTDALSSYVGYEFLNESYFLADRRDRRDRFMAFEQRLIAGVRYDLLERLALDLNAGYAFDRHYGEGRNQGSNLRDRINIESGPFLGASLRLKF